MYHQLRSQIPAPASRYHGGQGHLPDRRSRRVVPDRAPLWPPGRVPSARRRPARPMPEPVPARGSSRWSAACPGRETPGMC